MKTSAEYTIKSLLDFIFKQFFAHRRYVLLPLFFCLFSAVVYAILTYCCDVHQNVPERVLWDFLVCIWLTSPLLLSRRIPIRIWCILAGFIPLFLMELSLIVGLFYRIDATETCWDVIAGSSPEEIREYFSGLPWWLIAIACVAPVLTLIAWGLIVEIACRGKWSTPGYTRSAAPSLHIPVNLPFLLCFLPFTVIILCNCISSEPTRLLKKTLSLRYAYEFTKYQETWNLLARLENVNKQPPPFKSIQFDDQASDLLGVIVIGESASREHLNCYGYPRDTTPYFTSLKNELLLFDNIIASAGVTTEAIKYFLTDAEVEHGGFSPSVSLIPLLRHFGAEVWYISNQGRWTINNTPLVMMFRAANEMVFLKGAEVATRYENAYDDVLLPEFLRVMSLPRTNHPRFIFLHIMGSHEYFEQRFPKEEEFFPPSFRDELNLPEYMEEAQAELNAYDSSIRYTDKILKTVLERLKQENDSNSFLLYFSDHGEVLNATGDNRRSFSCKRYELYEIPFILWASERYQQNYPEIMQNGLENRHKLAQTDRLFPSLCHLMRLTWDAFPDSGDLFSPQFQPMTKIWSALGKSTTFTDKDGQNVVFPTVRTEENR